MLRPSADLVLHLEDRVVAEAADAPGRSRMRPATLAPAQVPRTSPSGVASAATHTKRAPTRVAAQVTHGSFEQVRHAAGVVELRTAVARRVRGRAHRRGPSTSRPESSARRAVRVLRQPRWRLDAAFAA